MSIKTRSLGSNVSVVTYSLGTTLPELVSAINREIIRRVEIDGRFISAHGWELLEELSSLDRVYRSLCADGKTFKYLRMVFNEAKLTLYAYTDWSVATSIGVDEVCLSDYGSFEEIELNFEDRGNFFIFANPRWLAFCSKQYGSPILLNRNANGIHGIFETEVYESDALDPQVPFCLLSTALIGGDHDGIGYIIPRANVPMYRPSNYPLSSTAIIATYSRNTYIAFGGTYWYPIRNRWGLRMFYVENAGDHTVKLIRGLGSIYIFINGESVDTSKPLNLGRGWHSMTVRLYSPSNNASVGFVISITDPTNKVIVEGLEANEWACGEDQNGTVDKYPPLPFKGLKIATIFGMIDPEYPNKELLPSEHNVFSGNGWAMPVVLMSDGDKIIGRVFGLKFGTRNKDFFLDKVSVDCDSEFWNAHEDSVSIPTDHAIIPSGLGANGVTSARYLLPF